MLISADRIKKRAEVRDQQVSSKDAIFCKLRDKIRSGYAPKTPEELAGVLKLAAEYYKLVGAADECHDIIEKLAEEEPMEKYGVECNGKHSLSDPCMEKTADGEEAQCKSCGFKVSLVKLGDEVKASDKADNPSQQSIEKMFGV